MASSLSDLFGAPRVRTFLGLPDIAELMRAPVAPAAIVLGADTATPYASVGAYCAGGADAVRAGAADFAANRGHVNFDLGMPVAETEGALCDGGNILVDPGDAPANRARIEEAVRAVRQIGAVPVLLGGDDSLPIPVIAALREEGPIWVVQVDAHIDWRDEVQGERLGLSSPMRRASEMAHVAGIVQLGARGVGSARPSDLADAEGWGARIHPMRALDMEGVERALAAIPEDAQIVLCFDWDVLDPAIQPAVIARTPGGMGYWMAARILEAVAARGRLRAAVFAEFVPERDMDGQGARVAAGLAMLLLGLVARARARV